MESEKRDSPSVAVNTPAPKPTEPETPLPKKKAPPRRTSIVKSKPKLREVPPAGPRDNDCPKCKGDTENRPCVEWVDILRDEF